MSNVARLGDLISCGDIIIQGSADVIIEDLPVALKGMMTVGHNGFHPTFLTGECSNTVIINDSPVALKNKTVIQPHGKRRTPPHSGTIVSSASTVSIEE